MAEDSNPKKAFQSRIEVTDNALNSTKETIDSFEEAKLARIAALPKALAEEIDESVRLDQLRQMSLEELCAKYPEHYKLFCETLGDDCGKFFKRSSLSLFVYRRASTELLQLNYFSGIAYAEQSLREKGDSLGSYVAETLELHGETDYDCSDKTQEQLIDKYMTTIFGSRWKQNIEKIKNEFYKRQRSENRPKS